MEGISASAAAFLTSGAQPGAHGAADSGGAGARFARLLAAAARPEGPPPQVAARLDVPGDTGQQARAALGAALRGLIAAAADRLEAVEGEAAPDTAQVVDEAVGAMAGVLTRFDASTGANTLAMLSRDLGRLALESGSAPADAKVALSTLAARIDSLFGAVPDGAGATGRTLPQQDAQAVPASPPPGTGDVANISERMESDRPPKVVEAPDEATTRRKAEVEHPAPSSGKLAAVAETDYRALGQGETTPQPPGPQSVADAALRTDLLPRPQAGSALPPNENGAVAVIAPAGGVGPSATSVQTTPLLPQPDAQAVPGTRSGSPAQALATPVPVPVAGTVQSYPASALAASPTGAQPAAPITAEASAPASTTIPSPAGVPAPVASGGAASPRADVAPVTSPDIVAEPETAPRPAFSGTIASPVGTAAIAVSGTATTPQPTPAVTAAPAVAHGETTVEALGAAPTAPAPTDPVSPLARPQPVEGTASPPVPAAPLPRSGQASQPEPAPDRLLATLPTPEARATLAVAAPVAPSHPAEPQGMAAALHAQIRGHSFREGTTLIELSPAGLGDLEIELAPGEGGGLRIVLRAENPLVLAALRSDRDTLLGLLRDGGAQTGGASLSFEDFGARQGTGRQHRTDPEPPPPAALADPEPAPPEPIRRAAGRIDILT